VLGSGIDWVSRAAARVGTRVLVVIVPLSALVNVLSQSLWQRLLMAPAALVLAALCLIVARSADNTVGSASDQHDRTESSGIHSSVEGRQIVVLAFPLTGCPLRTGGPSHPGPSGRWGQLAGRWGLSALTGPPPPEHAESGAHEPLHVGDEEVDRGLD
jgi:hypothetical protein